MLAYARRYIFICLFVCVLFFLFTMVLLDIQGCYQRRFQITCKKYYDVVEVQNFYQDLSNVVRKNNLKNERIMISKKAQENVKEYRSHLWRIQIPKLKLDAPIIEGTSQRVLANAVGHFEETDRWKGNVALAGHNRGYRCNFFQKIKNLEKGDLIIYCTKEGKRTYQVEINTVIEETDWQYIENTKDNRITLITCEEDKREYRRCIQAIEVL